VAKTLTKITISVAALATATWLGISSGRASGDAPWCAVINIAGGDVYWDCRYHTIEECRPNVIAGNRGFCNLNPWPGPSQAVHLQASKTVLAILTYRPPRLVVGGAGNKVKGWGSTRRRP